MLKDSLPVVLLTFADPRHGKKAVLRQLPEEQRKIREALKASETAGHCRLVERAHVTPEDLYKVLLEQRDAVAILHYGGHADGSHLLFESASGWPAEYHGHGLATLLGQQPGLVLVFLNACSTEAHAQRLLDQGVAAVLTTSQSIKDEVARRFAVAFYQSLGAGDPLATAFTQAEGQVRAHYGDDPAKLYAAGQADPDRWPWRLHISLGAKELLATWSLPQAANDPLFGLPEPPTRDLPDSPYKHLEPFGERDAGIFFGRNREIRTLYQAITAPADEPPILLLHGSSGVGKSSLLAAGILPRLQDDFVTLYERRDGTLGLTATLAHALGAEGPEANLLVAWQQLATNRPLLVVLDQVEEAWTRPFNTSADKPTELEAFASALHNLFGVPDSRPHGRLVLGFREEWLAQVRQLLRDSSLPANPIHILPLTFEAIHEIVLGPTNTEALRRRYNLTVDPEVPNEIAHDLAPRNPLESHRATSVIAPTLQILLTKIWSTAQTESPSAPSFHRALYNRLREQGLHLDDFLNEALARLAEEHPNAASSGLALDVLAHHTTPLGTAAVRSAQEVVSRYPEPREIPPLLEACRSLYLLTGNFQTEGGSLQPISDEEGNLGISRLAHDTLAPLVRQRFDESDLPGQRARRILKERTKDWDDGRNGTPLDARDLALVQTGTAGMRALTTTHSPEHRLLTASEKARRRSRFRTQSTLLLVATLFLTIAALTSITIYQTHLTELQILDSLLQKGLQQAEPEGRSDLALAFFAAAVRADPEDRIGQLHLLTELERNNLRSVLQTDSGISNATFDSPSTIVARGPGRNTISFWNINTGTQVKPPLAIPFEPSNFTIGPRGRFATFSDSNGRLQLWNLRTSDKIELEQIDPLSIPELYLSPDESLLATIENDGIIRLWETATGRRFGSSLQGTSSYSGILFNQELSRLAAFPSNNGTEIWNISSPGKVKQIAFFEGPLQHFSFAANNENSAIKISHQTIDIIDTQNGTITKSTHFSESIRGIVDVSSDQSIAIVHQIGGYHAWNLDPPALIKRLPTAPYGVTASISPTGDHVFLSELLGGFQIVNTNSWLQQKHPQGFQGFFTKNTWSIDGQQFATSSDSDLTEIWTIEPEITKEPHSLARPPLPLIAIQKIVRAEGEGQPSVSLVHSREPTFLEEHFQMTPRTSSAPLSQKGNQLALTSHDNVTTVRSTLSTNVIGFPIHHESEPRSIQFSLDGEHLIATYRESQVAIWNIATGRLAGPKLSLASPPSRITLSTNGIIAAALTINNQLISWRVQTRQVLSQVDLDRYASPLIISNDGRHIALTSGPDFIQVFNTYTGDAVGERFRADSSVPAYTSASLSPEGNVIAIASRRRNGVRIGTWDTTSGKNLAHSRELHCQGLTINSVSNDGSAAQVECKDNPNITNSDQGSLAVETVINREKYASLATLSPDLQRVSLAYSDNTTEVWQISETNITRHNVQHDQKITNLEIDHSGSDQLLAYYDDDTIQNWNWRQGISTGTKIPHFPLARRVRFGPRGREIFTAPTPLSIQPWDSSNSTPLTKPMIHRGRVQGITPAPASSLVATLAKDRSLSLWDASRGNLITETKTAFQVSAPEFTVDDRFLMTRIYGGYSQVLELPILSTADAVALADLAESIAGLSIESNGRLKQLAERTTRLAEARHHLASAENQYVRALSQWIFQHPWNRETQPNSGVSILDYTLHSPQFAREWFPKHPVVKNCALPLEKVRITPDDLDRGCIQQALEQLVEWGFISDFQVETKLLAFDRYAEAKGPVFDFEPPLTSPTGTASSAPAGSARPDPAASTPARRRE